MSAQDSIGQYRLRRLALQLKAFTVSDLETAAGVSTATVHYFVHELDDLTPGLITKDKVEREGPGRRPQRFMLTPKGVEHLAEKNLALAQELNQVTFQEDESLRPKPLPKPRWEERVPSPSPSPCWPEPVFVLDAFQPEWAAASHIAASALLVRPGQASVVRTGAEMQPLTEPIRTGDELWEITDNILTPWQKERLRSRGSVVCGYRSKEYGPVGLKVQIVSGKPEIELRPLPHRIPSLEELHLPRTVLEFSQLKCGMIVTGGIGGSGRSRVMAGLVDHINETQQERIATIEEPLLYFHEAKHSLIEQRQVGIDAPDFATALKDSLEQKTNVLVLSDVTEPETFVPALAAAERSLVICRVSAASSVEAIEKLIGLSPPAQQGMVRSRLAANLAGVIGLTALPRAGGNGFVYAAEVLRIDNAARDLIRDRTKIHQLPEYLGEKDPSTQTFERAVEKLYEENLVSEEWMARHFPPAKLQVGQTRRTSGTG